MFLIFDKKHFLHLLEHGNQNCNRSDPVFRIGQVGNLSNETGT